VSSGEHCFMVRQSWEINKHTTCHHSVIS
jgi:hypothetical protein